MTARCSAPIERTRPPGRNRHSFETLAYRSAEQAKSLRKRHQGEVFIAGMFIAAFVSIPIVSLATPLFAMALMVHMHRRTMVAGRRQLPLP